MRELKETEYDPIRNHINKCINEVYPEESPPSLADHVYNLSKGLVEHKLFDELFPHCSERDKAGMRMFFNLGYFAAIKEPIITYAQKEE